MMIVMHNIRSVYNVGAILRTMDGFGLSEAVASGYTPHLKKGLPHERLRLEESLHKTALGAEKTVRLTCIPDIHAWILARKAEGFLVVALEQAPRSIALGSSDFIDKDRLILVLGEEVEGVNSEILELCDEIVEIPMCGMKESFNVSVAAGIAMWEIIGRDRR